MDLIRSIQMSENDIRELKQRCEDGELTMEMIADTIEAIQGEINAKCDSIAEIINANEGDIRTLSAESRRLTRIETNLECSNAQLKNGLMNYLKQKGIPKVKTQYHSFGICKNGGRLGVSITKEVPEEYIKYEPTPDIRKIRKALDDGAKLDFACYSERGEHLRIN